MKWRVAGWGIVEGEALWETSTFIAVELTKPVKSPFVYYPEGRVMFLRKGFLEAIPAQEKGEP